MDNSFCYWSTCWVLHITVRVLQSFGKLSKTQLPEKINPNIKIKVSEKPQLYYYILKRVISFKTSTTTAITYTNCCSALFNYESK
jgi:hypothetical protein